MPNHEFENYLALVSRLMRLNRSQTESIRQELSDHLETRVSELVESGIDVVAATRRALEEFGDAAVLAKEFQGIFQLTRRRWMMRFATFSIAATFLAAVLIMAMWPSAARFGAPSTSIAQDVPDATGADAASQPHSVAIGSTNTVVANTKREPAPRRTIMSSEDVDRQLQQPADFDFVDTPMREVMDMIRELHGFNILLNETARADLDEDSSITFKIKDVRFSTALRLMLNEHNTTYVVQDGILKLISLDFSEDPEFFRRKIFDCRELLASIRKAERDRIGTPIGLNSLEERGGLSGRGGGVFNRITRLFGSTFSELGAGRSVHGPVFGRSYIDEPGETQLVKYSAAQQEKSTGAPSNNPTTELIPNGNSETAPAGEWKHPPQQSSLPAVEHVIVRLVTAESILTDLIKTSVEPESWDTSNGDGTLTIVGGFMVVTQTQATLDEIANLISELENRMK